MKPIFCILGMVSIAACSEHSASTNTAKPGTTKAFLIDAPFPYDQVARVDVYIVSVAASSKPDTLGTGGPGTIATPHRAYNLLELGNGSAAKLGEGVLLSGQYVQFFVTIDGDSSSITLKDGTVLTSRTSPGINWNGYPGRFSFGLFTDPPIQVDRKSTRLNSSHGYISYAVFCLKKKKKTTQGLDRFAYDHRADAQRDD